MSQITENQSKFDRKWIILMKKLQNKRDSKNGTNRIANHGTSVSRWIFIHFDGFSYQLDDFIFHFRTYFINLHVFVVYFQKISDNFRRCAIDYRWSPSDFQEFLLIFADFPWMCKHFHRFFTKFHYGKQYELHLCRVEGVWGSKIKRLIMIHCIALKMITVCLWRHTLNSSNYPHRFVSYGELISIVSASQVYINKPSIAYTAWLFIYIYYNIINLNWIEIYQTFVFVEVAILTLCS